MHSSARSAQQLAIEAAQAGGAVIRRALATGFREVDPKGAVDLLTEVDLAAQHAICEVLAARDPGTVILAEEAALANTAGAPARWIVDPLDGTTNFVHGFPAFGVSVALEVGGELFGGCIYEPLLDRTTCAGKGLGTLQDDRPVQVSKVDTLDRALMLTGFAYDRRDKADMYLRFVKAFLVSAQGLRRAGSAALDFCHIAAGRADGYWEFNLSPWDVAAGLLFVQEAGGRVSDPRGAPIDLDHPQIVACNPHVHDEVLSVLEPLLNPQDGPAAPGCALG